MIRTVWGVLGVGLLQVAAGCGSKVVSPAQICAPGQSVACVGPGGCPGAQVCNADGTAYLTCDCGSPDVGTKDIGPSVDASSDVADGMDASSETTSEADVATDTAGAFDCLVDDPGTSDESSLDTFEYVGGPCTTPAKGCYWSFKIFGGCTLDVQENGPGFTRSATADASDCLAIRKWATSKKLKDGLSAPSSCTSSVTTYPDPSETTTVTLKIGTPLSVNSAFCAIEPFVANRSCIAAIRKKYFPKK